MRIPRILSILLFVCLGISSLRAQNSDAALDRFRKDMATLNAYARGKSVELKANPLAGVLMFRAVVAGMKTVQTEGLPEDLKAAFADAVATFVKASAIFQDWPEKPDEVVPYVRQRVAQDPNYMAAFSSKMNDMGKQIDAMSKRMDEMGRKYGFDMKTGGAAPK